MIKQRTEQLVLDNKGSVSATIDCLKSELDNFEDLWSMYSSDCLGHGITFNRLAIRYLERNSAGKRNNRRIEK